MKSNGETVPPHSCLPSTLPHIYDDDKKDDDDDDNGSDNYDDR